MSIYIYLFIYLLIDAGLKTQGLFMIGMQYATELEPWLS